MQATVFIALMASVVLASPIGRYGNPALRPRYPIEGAPYKNSTSTISASISASSIVASELMFILPSTESTPTASFSSAVVPSRTFQNVKDGVPTSTPNAASSATITSTKTAEAPVKTTKTLSTSSGISTAISSTSQRSLGDAAGPTSVVTVPGDTVVASSTVTGSTSDAVVTPPTSSMAVTSNKLAASATTSSTSDAVVTPSSTSDIVSTQKYEQTSAMFSSVRFPIGTTKPLTSKPVTTSATIVTSEPVVTSSGFVTISTPTTSASLQSTATTSASASPSAIVGDKFGNKQLAITENKGFTTLTATSKCDPTKMSTQNACIGGAFAQCGSNGVYIVVSACSAPTKCFSMPLEITAGTSVGCTTPDDAAYRMGLANAAELESLLSGGSAASSTPVSTTTTATATSNTSIPAKTTAAISQEPKIPVPSQLLSSETMSLPTPTTDSGDYASLPPVPTTATATTDISLPAKTTATTSQEPKLPVPSQLLSTETKLLPTPTPASPSITSAPVPGASRVTVTVVATVTVKG